MSFRAQHLGGVGVQNRMFQSRVWVDEFPRPDAGSDWTEVESFNPASGLMSFRAHQQQTHKGDVKWFQSRVWVDEFPRYNAKGNLVTFDMFQSRVWVDEFPRGVLR